MLLGTVVGQVWATKKEPTLQGLRLLVIQPFTTDGRASAETLIAVDPMGAGVGERVLVVFGRAARHTIGRGHDIGFQSAVAAILDGGSLWDGREIEPHVELGAGAGPAAEAKNTQGAKRSEASKR
ncbi:MAG: ethanolamine utilization protein EutN [Planctomycetota bacterium]|nr:MAG: ethanolamine utilization protein EutN [Planctomycetota bacterium]